MNILEQLFTNDIAAIAFSLLVTATLLHSGAAMVSDLRQKLFCSFVPRGQAAL